MSIENNTYISWGVLNNGSVDIHNKFFVDVYLGDILAERWEIDGLSANQYVIVQDWSGLNDRINIDPGSYVLSLVIDSTGLLKELDESDNRFEVGVFWEGKEIDSEDSKSVQKHLPDLVPWMLHGWEDFIVANSYPDSITNGTLSRDVQSYIRFGFSNQSLISIPKEMWVYTYLDNVLVNAQKGKGLLAEESIGSNEWGGLNTTIPISPGSHKLKIELDATNLIIESNERNNVIEREFIWLTGPVEDKTRYETKDDEIVELPSQLSLPNLVPGWRDGWDGPIIVSNTRDTMRDSKLTLEATTYVDLITHNRSTVEVQDEFAVDLYVDKTRVKRFNLSANMEPNELRWILDWSDLNNTITLNTGTYNLSMVIDPEDSVQESDETDNIFQKEFTWISGNVSDTGPVVYTEQELQGKLEDIQQILDKRLVAVDSNDTNYREDVLRIVDAGYYLINGRSVFDERVDILILSKNDFLNWIDDYYSEQFALKEQEYYETIFNERERVKGRGSGLKTSRFGRDAIVVNGERMIADVIGTIAHELGHMRQGISNPDYSKVNRSTYWKAMKEAQAQQFEKTFWLSIENFLGLKLMEYPDSLGFNELIDKSLQIFLDKSKDDEHILGLLIQWLIVLDDPYIRDSGMEFDIYGQLSYEESKTLYEYLVSISAYDVEIYVAKRLSSLDFHINYIHDVMKKRLLTSVGIEGSPDLRAVSLFMP
jgi:hypothetical protein